MDEKQKPPPPEGRRSALQGLALGLVGAGDGENVGQEKDDEADFDFPKDGFDDGGQRRVEETRQVGHQIEDGLARGADAGAVWDDGGDFGDVGLVEETAGEVAGDFFAQLVEELFQSEEVGPTGDGAEENVVHEVAPSADDGFNDEVNEDQGDKRKQDEEKVGLLAEEEVAKAKDQSGRIDDAEDEVRPGNEAGNSGPERLAASDMLTARLGLGFAGRFAEVVAECDVVVEKTGAEGVGNVHEVPPLSGSQKPSGG